MNFGHGIEFTYVADGENRDSGSRSEAVFMSLSIDDSQRGEICKFLGSTKNFVCD